MLERLSRLPLGAADAMNSLLYSFHPIAMERPPVELALLDSTTQEED